MKRIRFFTLLFALVTTAVTGWAQTDYSTVLTSNVGLSNTGTNDYGTAVKVQFELGKTVPQYDAFLAEQMQIGTANRYAGAVTITAPAGTKKLHFHAVTRTDGTSQLQVGVPNGSGSLLSTTLVKDEGFTGSTPIILTTSPANCFFTVTFNTALTEDTQVAFFSTKTSGNGDPFLLYGVNAETVLTVAQALQQSTGNRIYVRGIVAKKNEMSDGSITYWISDDGTETNMLQISNGKNLNGTDFTSDSELRKRDQVVVYGTTFGRQGNVQTLTNNYLISVTHPEEHYYINYAMASEWVKEEMEEREDGTYYKRIAVSDNYVFTIYGSENDESFGSPGGITIVGNTNVLVSNKDGNIYVMTIDDPGTYDVVFNPTTRELTVTVAEAFYFVYNNDLENKIPFVPDTNQEKKYYLEYDVYLSQRVPIYVVNKDGIKFGPEEDKLIEAADGGSCELVENGQNLSYNTSAFYTVTLEWREDVNSWVIRCNKNFDKHFYCLTTNETEDGADKVTELVYIEGTNTYEADIEVGSNGNIYISTYNTWADKEKECFNTTYNITNYLGTAFPLQHRPWPCWIGIPGNYHLSLNPEDMSLTVTIAEERQKFYYSGGINGYGPDNMPELTYNFATNAYEAEVEITAEQNWIIITGNKANDWGEWGNLQYYGISEGNAYNRDYIVTAGDNELQIQETASADFLFLVPGTYKISLTPDLKFSVTWPEGISDKYYFRKGSSIEEMSQPSSDGSYYYTVNLTPSDVQNTSDYPVFEIVSGDGHTYGPQGENWVITETNCQNLPVVKDTRMKWFKVSEPGEYTFIFNPTAMTLSVTMPTTEYKYYFLKINTDWSGAAQVGEMVYNAETNTYESTEYLVVEEDPGFANFYISTKDNFTDMWLDYYGSSKLVDLAEVNSIKLTAQPNYALAISSVGSYHLSLDAVNMKLTVTAAVDREKMYFWPASKGFNDFSTVTEMTYNPATNAHEYEVEFTDDYLTFYITDYQATGWADMTAEHVYGSSETGNTSDVQLSPALTSIQLEKHNAGFTISIPGTYKISIDADNKMMTVSGFKQYYYWPAPGYIISEGTQTELVYNVTTGAYEATVTAEADDNNQVIAILSDANPKNEYWLAYNNRIGYDGIINIGSPVQLESDKWVMLEKSGTYHLSLNPRTMQLTVREAAEAEKYYLKMWSDVTATWNNKEMEEREDGTFYKRINVTDESSSIIIESGIGEQFGSGVIDGSGTPVELTGQSLMSISSGTYDVVFAPTTMMLTVTKIGESSQTDISDLDNVIYMEPQEVRTGSQATLSFKMKNNVPIRSFQFDLYLPEGVSAATNASSGKILATLTTDRLPEDDGHTLTTSIQPDGAVRFLCGSLDDENFAVGDDIVLTLKVDVSEEMQEGEYSVSLKTMTLTETNINNHYDSDCIVSKLTVSSYLLGDVNGDGSVNVLDYTSVANYIHGNEADGFVFKAGDVDANGVINALDYTGIANIIHTGSPFGASSSGAKAAVIVLEEANEMDPE